jgi:hypothetical protein
LDLDINISLDVDVDIKINPTLNLELKTPEFDLDISLQELYFAFWNDLPDNFFKNSNLLSISIDIFKIGVKEFGIDGFPSEGWGITSHKDKASMNMVRAYQAALNLFVNLDLDGKYGSITEAVSKFFSNNIDQDYIWPTFGRLSSVFGSRTPPVWYENGVKMQGSGKHYGLDIGNRTGTRVNATAGGTVIFAEDMGGKNGNIVVIDHGGGIFSYYFHVDSYNVSVGQIVKQGEQIARMGNTGGGTGPHLHFAISEGGEKFNRDNYADPLKYLPYPTLELKLTSICIDSSGNFVNY